MSARKAVYLAKETEGSIIEVIRKGRDWITIDGRCTYEKGSFDWTVKLADFQAVLRARINGDA